MAECRCGVCEHCTAEPRPRVGHAADGELTSHAPTSRRLLTRMALAGLRSRARADSDESRILDAYETAVRLLEEVVRDPDTRTQDGIIGPADIAWLALREAEQ